MNTNITKKRSIDAVERKSYSEITDSQGSLQASLLLLAKGIRFGWKREFYQAVALYNIKTFDQLRSKGKSFHDFTAEIGLSATSTKRYVRIGKRLTQMMYGESNDTLFLTEDTLEKLCDSITKNGHITLRGLDSASRDLNLFKKYLQGEISELQLQEKSHPHLLGEPIDAKKQIATKNSKPVVIESNTASSEMLAYGLWERFEEKIDALPQSLWSDIDRHGKQFVDFYLNSDPSFRTAIREKFLDLNRSLTKTKELLSALHRCDIADAKAVINEEELP